MTAELVPSSRAGNDLPGAPPVFLGVAGRVLDETPNAAFAADEFFKASIGNEHTRRAYGRIVGRFLAWCGSQKLTLCNITPGRTGEIYMSARGFRPD